MDAEAENTVKKWLIVGLLGLVLVVLAGLVFFRTPAQPPAASLAVEAEADIRQNLSEQSSTGQSGAAVGVRPDIIINRAKDVAGQVERNREP